MTPSNPRERIKPTQSQNERSLHPAGIGRVAPFGFLGYFGVLQKFGVPKSLVGRLRESCNLAPKDAQGKNAQIKFLHSSTLWGLREFNALYPRVGKPRRVGGDLPPPPPAPKKRLPEASKLVSAHGPMKPPCKFGFELSDSKILAWTWQRNLQGLLRNREVGHNNNGKVLSQKTAARTAHALGLGTNNSRILVKTPRKSNPKPIALQGSASGCCQLLTIPGTS